jgi:muramoyltetrapeptide carboxypeptidase
MKTINSAEIIKPYRLKKGDTIGIIAPADPVRGVCPENIITRGYEYLKGKGFNILEGESVRDLLKGHTAGSIDTRIKDITDFLENESVTCIMAFWGGLNSNQLLDNLDYKLIRAKRKIFIGYSDVTALTTAITNISGLVTFSGPGVISFAKPEPFEYTWSHFEKMCMSGESVKVVPSYNYADDKYFLRKDDDHRIIKINKGIKVYKTGSVSGRVVAGHLQTLLLLNDTDYLEDVTGKILFIEEDEATTPAHVDRFFCQMKHIGWLDKIEGIVIGRFTEYSKFSVENTFENILERYLNDVKYPVLYNVDFGHSDPMITIPNGGICHIEGSDIFFEASVV